MTTVEHSVDARAQAGGVDDSDKSGDPDPEVPERARGPRRYSAKYKARVLAEYEALNKADKGALLRREGLYSSLISEWRKQRDRVRLVHAAIMGARHQRCSRHGYRVYVFLSRPIGIVGYRRCLTSP